MNSKIKDALHNIYNESVKNPSKTLDGHIKNEIGIVNDYRGRAIYEFFQNAIDRAESKIWIHLDKSKKTLTIANDGKPFSIDKEGRSYSDLESLCSINTSSKNQNESIGNKGVGFKSCWEYTSKVCVCSTFEENTHWGFEMHNPLTIDEVATIDYNIVKQWIKNEDYFTVFENNGRKVPSFYYPLPIDNADCYFNSYEGAKTVITFLDLNENKIYDLDEKIHEFSEHYIFFVNQLDNLKGSNVELELKIDETIIKTLNTIAKVDEWLIVNKVFEGEELTKLQELSANLNYEIKFPKIAIAFPLKQEKANELLFHPNFYCYLPTEIECGFNVLIHADFLLDVSRKQIDFNNNNYNKKLLEHIAKLYIKTLLDKEELHELSYFGMFLLPINKDGKFESQIQAILFKENTITEILKKVYTSQRKWDISSYQLIFNVLNKWRRHNGKEKTYVEFYKNVYEETVNFFCDPDVFIIPHLDKDTIAYLRPLPVKKEDNDNNNTKLFYRKESNSIRSFDILEQFNSVSVSSFNELEPLIKFGIVKEFEAKEILRALNHEVGKLNHEVNIDKNIMYEKILRFIVDLDINTKNDDLHLYFSGDSIERQMSRINLPCKDNNWHPAIQCYTNIADEINSCFNTDFFELDLEEFKRITDEQFSEPEDINIGLCRFGVWDSKLPISYVDGKYRLSFEYIPKLKTNKLKLLINNTCNDWQNLKGKNDLLELFSSEEWFYDEINQKFVSPLKLFLFNDNRVRKCIHQEKKNDRLKELYTFFNIHLIEETDNKQKLVTQLHEMKDSDIDENHKTVYKQIVLRLSKFKDDNIKEIPLLTTQAIYTKENEKCWFVPYEQRKYTYHFQQYKYANFDIETALKFISNLNNVGRFDAKFSIKPDLNDLKPDIKIKEFFERNYLPTFFALAENAISSTHFDKEKCINRWNNLNIFKAYDVWLEVSFNNETIELYKGEKKDVLYEPLSKIDKVAEDEVGTLAHDLDNFEDNPNIYKFGYAIAEAVFRDQNFGEVLTNFIQKKQLDSKGAVEFLSERGIDETEIKESKTFIEKNVINEDDKIAFIKILREKINDKITNDNWTELELYTPIGSFENIDIERNNPKFQFLLNIINPIEQNRKFLLENKKQIQVDYYISSEIELSDEVYKELSENSTILQSYTILDKIYKELGIDNTKLTEDARKNAEVKLEIKNIAKLQELESINPEPVESNKQLIKMNISSEGQAETHTINRTADQREANNKALHERGLGFERILTLEYAKEIIQKKQVEYIKNIICQIEELKILSNYEVKEDVKSIAKLLHVSESVGDGLGYDVIKPIFENDKLVDFNFVEVKSSKNDFSIHLSENERRKILFFAERTKKWKLYHFVNGQNNDRTEVVLNAVKEHAKIYNGEQLLVGVDWMISFER